MKDFILDTNVLLHDSNAIFNFEENNIIIPMIVVEEIDHFKKEMSEIGRNARFFSKKIDELRSQGSVSEGVLVNNKGGILRISLCSTEALSLLPPEMDKNIPDNQILAVALFNKSNSENPTVLISKDTNMRIKADALELPAENYTNDKVEVEDLYSGILCVSDESEIPAQEYLLPNQYVVVKNACTGIITKEVRYDKGMGELVPLREDLTSWGLDPANDEQRYLMDLLLNDDIKLVTVNGKAGCGKTLCVLAASLRKVTDDFVYRKLLVSRPVMPMGRDIGFLPGPQPLDAKILTPVGWTTMGELEIGTRVITRSGNSASVVGIYPKGVKKVYKVTTTEGTSTECCEDHLWLTTTSENRKRKKAGSVKTTKQIIDTLYNKFGKLNHHIPRNEAVKFNEGSLPLPPYVLGVILGDGSISDSIMFTSKDQEIVDRMREELAVLGCNVTHVGGLNYNISGNLYNNKPAKQVCIIDLESGETKIYPSIGIALQTEQINRSTLHHRCLNQRIIAGKKYLFIDSNVRWSNPVKEILYKLGLSNTKAWTKFIPSDYLFSSSIEGRLALLRGLMDADGCAKESTGEAAYCTTSLQLAEDVQTLVKSLGGRVVIKKRDRVGKVSVMSGESRDVIRRRPSYEFVISLPNEYNPFHLPRKAERFYSNYVHGVCIEKIEYIGDKPVQCIMIDDPEHLYLTDDFLVTHNTVEEKLSPYIQPIKDNVEFLVSGSTTIVKPPSKRRGKKAREEEEKDAGLLSNGYAELEAAGIMEVEPLLYIRGRSIPNVVMIVDEAQNLSPHEIKTILTRAGEGTKLIFTGDIEQIDSPYLDASSNGLTYIIDKFKDQSIAAHITLIKGERSELAEISSKIL